MHFHLAQNCAPLMLTPPYSSMFRSRARGRDDAAAACNVMESSLCLSMGIWPDPHQLRPNMLLQIPQVRPVCWLKESLRLVAPVYGHKLR
uniref:Uncharacterized protein n=1 Tax=Oryza brachyantha TaxID=4533 RepID=J3MUD7_ORYBR